MTRIYVTVDHFGASPVADRPPCQGCTPSVADGEAPVADRAVHAEYQIVGASGTIALCRTCAIHSIKSLAARFVMFDPGATRDLMDFFAAEATKKRPAPRRKRPAKVIDVAGLPASKALPAPRRRSGKEAP